MKTERSTNVFKNALDAANEFSKVCKELEEIHRFQKTPLLTEAENTAIKCPMTTGQAYHLLEGSNNYKRDSEIIIELANIGLGTGHIERIINIINHE